MMYIFLDIDGVFTQLGEELNLDEDVPSLDGKCVSHFSDIITKYDRAKIVISSSWRETYDLLTIKSAFPESISAKIEGVTPILPYEHEPVEFFRYHEVLRYLKNVDAEDALWVAVDDIAEHYPPGVRIIITNPSVGFDEAAALQLDRFLKSATG